LRLQVLRTDALSLKRQRPSQARFTMDPPADGLTAIPPASPSRRPTLCEHSVIDCDVRIHVICAFGASWGWRMHSSLSERQRVGDRDDERTRPSRRRRRNRRSTIETTAGGTADRPRRVNERPASDRDRRPADPSSNPPAVGRFRGHRWEERWRPAGRDGGRQWERSWPRFGSIRWPLTVPPLYVGLHSEGQCRAPGQ
jgi:hypothetical protein